MGNIRVPCCSVAIVIAATSMLSMAAPRVESASPASTLVVVSSVVRGFKNAGPIGPEGPCGFVNQFRHNEQIAWRIKVFDSANHTLLDDKTLQSVLVKVRSVEPPLTAKYGRYLRSPSTATVWHTAWVVPLKYPAGTLSYTITATAKDGRTKTIDFGVGTSQVVILQGAVPTR